MALHALDFNTVKIMNPNQRTMYFNQYAGFIEDAPKDCYAIRVGSKNLYSDDMVILRMKFDAFIDRGYKAESIMEIADKITVKQRVLNAYGSPFRCWTHIQDQAVAERIWAQAEREDRKGYMATTAKTPRIPK